MQVHAFSTSALCGGKLLISCQNCFDLRKIASSICFIGGCVSFRVDLDIAGRAQKEKKARSRRWK
jgi:hypothetical protein